MYLLYDGKHMRQNGIGKKQIIPYKRAEIPGGYLNNVLK